MVQHYRYIVLDTEHMDGPPNHPNCA